MLKTYNDINDLPIQNWFKIHKDEDYGALLTEKKELTNDDIIKLILLWDVLNNQFIDRFGLSDEFIQEMDIRDKIAEYQADWIITKDNYYNTLIKVEEGKLKMFVNDTEEYQDLEKTLAKMSIHYKFKIDSRGLTTGQYYSYLHEITNGKES